MAIDPTFDQLALGKSLYRSKNYDEAVTAFRRAVAASFKPTQQLSALDFQIGAMIKLNQTDHALEAAKSMVRINRRDPRGYMRAGQVERLRDRPQAAAKWYQHGVKHVSPSDALHATLIKNLDKCEGLAANVMTSSKPCDPFCTLPLEVAEEILQYLSHRETVASLRVSKAWRNFLMQQPLFEDTIDFSQAKNQVTVIGLRASLQRLKQYPRFAKLGRLLTEPARDDLNNRLPHWFRKNTLEQLSTSHELPGLLEDHLPKDVALSHLDCGLSMRSAKAFMSKCTHLTNLGARLSGHEDAWDLQHQKLQSLRLSSMTSLVITSITLPRLQALDLEALDMQAIDFSRLTGLRRLRLRRCYVRRSFCPPRTMEHLELTSCFWRGTSPPAAFDLPGLITLRADLASWGVGMHQLRISADRIEIWDVDDQSLKNEDAHNFAVMVSLQQLILRHAHRIDGTFVKEVARNASTCLEYIGLFACERLGLDTAAWATSQRAIEVEIKSDTDHPSGRRVFT